MCDEALENAELKAEPGQVWDLTNHRMFQGHVVLLRRSMAGHGRYVDMWHALLLADHGAYQIRVFDGTLQTFGSLLSG